MKYVVALLAMLTSAAALADPPQVKIPWKGDYPHNSSKSWTKENPYDSGFSKNFKNGTPEEFGEVQKDGELNAFIYPSTSKDAKGPTPFVILLHGCDGLGTLGKEWARHVADLLNKEGVGVLVLDSFTTRYVDRSCGLADLHWGRRRADDAYSALDYLIEKKLAGEVYLMGYSNGGTTTLVSMTSQEADHPHHFAGAFAVAPGCSPSLQHSARYTGPIIIFMGQQDDANNPKWCEELAKTKRSVPVQMIDYQGANHGFPVNAPAHDFMGWHLSYNPTAEKDMMESIKAAIKMKKFGKGVELR